MALSTIFTRLTSYSFPNHCRSFASALLPLRCLDCLTPSVTSCLSFHPPTLSASLGRLSFGGFTWSLSSGLPWCRFLGCFDMG